MGGESLGIQNFGAVMFLKWYIDQKKQKKYFRKKRMGEESEKKRNSILSCLESALGDLFLEIAAKIPIENIEHNILPRNFGNILQL